MERLSSRHIDSIGEGCDNESGTVSKVLVTVVENGISNLEDVVTHEAIPISLELGLPLEFFRVGHTLILELVDDVTRVSIHSDHAHNLLTHAGGQIALHHENQLLEENNLKIVTFLHVAGLEGSLDTLHPVHKVDEEGHLSAIILKPVLLILLGEALEGVGRDGLDRKSHCVDDVLEVVLDFAFELELCGELNVLDSDGGLDTDGRGALILTVLLEFESFDSLENLGHVDHDLAWVVTVGKDVQKIVLSDEVETREGTSL